MFVCFYYFISLIKEPDLTLGHGELGNTSQGTSGGLDIHCGRLKIVCAIQTRKNLKEITFIDNPHNPAFHCKFKNAQA